MDIGRTLTGPVQRAGALAQNALEVARFGGLETGEDASPYEVIARDHDPPHAALPRAATTARRCCSCRR